MTKLLNFMQRYSLLVLIILASYTFKLYADYDATAGSGTHIVAFDGTHSGTSRCAAASTQCPASVLMNSAGTEIGNATTPVQISVANTGANATAIKVDNSAVTQPVSGTVTVQQGTAANLNATVVGTGTFATQSTLAAETTKVIGTVRNLGNAGAILDFAGQNASSPANAFLMGGQFNTSPTTITSGNASPLQLDNAGNLLVNVKNAPPNGAHNTANSSTTNLATDQAAIAAWGQVAAGAAPPTGVQWLGANASGATGGHIAGLISCDLHVFKHITTATDTLAVQGVASQTIYVCGALANGAGTATAFLENTASTNANCSSTNTQIAGQITAATASASGFYNPIWGGLKNTAGNGLCINSTGTGGIDVDVWYAQF